MDTGSTASIREAIEREDYNDAQRLWAEYADGLRQAVLAGTATPPLLAEARELIEWIRLSITALRAHTADRLGSLQAAGIYGGAAKCRAPFLQIRF